MYPPARVLPRHPHHQGGEDVVDRWPSGPVRVGPPSAYEAAMPAQGGSTTRWCGSGERDGKEYAKNQRETSLKASSTPTWWIWGQLTQRALAPVQYLALTVRAYHRPRSRYRNGRPSG